MFSAGSGVVAHWFHKKLGLALACMAGGSSIGGTIFPIILRNLIQTQRYAIVFGLVPSIVSVR